MNHPELDNLTRLAERNGWNVPRLCETFTIDHDRTNNGGIREIIALALVEDDPDWIQDMLNAQCW